MVLLSSRNRGLSPISPISTDFQKPWSVPDFRGLSPISPISSFPPISVPDFLEELQQNHVDDEPLHTVADDGHADLEPEQ
jgi:hypothetical protein